MKKITDMTEEEMRWYRKRTYIKRRYPNQVSEPWMTFRWFYTDVHTLEVNEQDVMQRIDTDKPFQLDNIEIVKKADFLAVKATKYIYQWKTYLDWAKLFDVQPDTVRNNVKRFGEEQAFAKMKKRYLDDKE